MTRQRYGAGLIGLLAAGLIGLLVPAVAEAAWVGFRNDTGSPILVQGASVVNNQLRRGKPRLLLPGEVYWDCILLPGRKLIIVADAQQPNVTLYQDFIIVAAADLFFSVQKDMPLPLKQAPKSRTPPPAPKAKLVPTKPPPDQLPGRVPWK